MFFILNTNHQELRVKGRSYSFEAMARSEYATVVMLLHLAVLAMKAGRRFIDTELFGEEIVTMLNEAH